MEACFTSAFEEDFREAFDDGRVQRAMERAERQSGTGKGADSGDDDKDGNGKTDLSELKAAMQPHIKLFYRLFRYYSAVGASSDTSNASALNKSVRRPLPNRARPTRGVGIRLSLRAACPPAPNPPAHDGSGWECDELVRHRRGSRPSWTPSVSTAAASTATAAA